MDQLVHSAPVSHLHTRGVVELCVAGLKTARITLKLTAVPRRRSAILVCPRLQARLACLTTRLRPRTLLPHHLTPDARFIQSP